MTKPVADEKKKKWTGGKCRYCGEEHLHIAVHCEKYPVRVKKRKVKP